MAKSKDIDKEKLRLEYLFEQGVNFVDRVIQINEEIGEASFAFMDAALSELERGSKKTITAIKAHRKQPTILSSRFCFFSSSSNIFSSFIR